jgi:hypothetical protein
MTSLPWHELALAGAAAAAAAGLLVAWRATNWPVMSSRFDPPARARPRQAAIGPRQAAIGPPRAPAAGGDTAAIWESLSRGEDPTDGGPGERALTEQDRTEPAGSAGSGTEGNRPGMKSAGNRD